jgi:hypothetical protein
MVMVIMVMMNVAGITTVKSFDYVLWFLFQGQYMVN